MALTLVSASFGALQFAQGVAAAPQVGSAFAPAYRTDAAVVAGACLDKERVWGVVDAFIDKLGAMSGAQAGEIGEVKAMLAGYKADPFKDAPENVRSFLDESGLRNADLRWAVMSFEEMPDFSAGSSIPNGLSVAIAGSFDRKRVLRAFERKLSEKEVDAAKFTEEPLDGETVWHLVPLNEKSAKDMKDNNVDLYVAWLDNQLAVAALSRDALARQIRLYRRGEQKGDALRGFADAGTVVGLFVSGVGDIIRRTAPPESLEGLNAIPNGKQIMYGLKTMAIDLKSASGEDIRLSLRVGMASEADADVIRTYVKTGLMVARAQLAQDPEVAGLLKVLDGVKVGGAEGVLEVSLDTTVSDLADALSKVIAQMSKPKAAAPAGTGKARRSRRTAAPADNVK